MEQAYNASGKKLPVKVILKELMQAFASVGMLDTADVTYAGAVRVTVKVRWSAAR